MDNIENNKECETCSKFSHCNNNDLIVKLQRNNQENEELKNDIEKYKECETCSKLSYCEDNDLICMKKYLSMEDKLRNTCENLIVKLQRNNQENEELKNDLQKYKDSLQVREDSYCKLKSELQVYKKELEYYKLKVELNQYKKAINDIKTLVTNNENYYTDEILNIIAGGINE